MGTTRWTIRGIPRRVRQTVRRIRQCTGMSAGEVVAAAIESFAEAHREAPMECQANDDNALEPALRALQAKLSEQQRLFAVLADRAGSIRVGR